MWQQFIHPAVRMRRQPIQHVLQIGIRIMSIELGRLNQAHDGRPRLPARTEPTKSQFLPKAIGRIWFSIQLLSMGNCPSSR